MHAVRPPMAGRRRGAVLNTASTAAFQPLPGQAGYAAAKAFVLSYSHAIRPSCAGRGVGHRPVPRPGGHRASPMPPGSPTPRQPAMPKFMWVPKEQVAKAAVDGLAHDRAVVIPGAANRLGAAAAYLTPRGILGPMLARRHPALRPRP